MWDSITVLTTGQILFSVSHTLQAGSSNLQKSFCDSNPSTAEEHALISKLLFALPLYIVVLCPPIEHKLPFSCEAVERHAQLQNGQQYWTARSLHDSQAMQLRRYWLGHTVEIAMYRRHKHFSENFQRNSNIHCLPVLPTCQLLADCLPEPKKEDVYERYTPKIKFPSALYSINEIEGIGSKSGHWSLLLIANHANA